MGAYAGGAGVVPEKVSVPYERSPRERSPREGSYEGWVMSYGNGSYGDASGEGQIDGGEVGDGDQFGEGFEFAALFGFEFADGRVVA